MELTFANGFATSDCMFQGCDRGGGGDEDVVNGSPRRGMACIVKCSKGSVIPIGIRGFCI